MRKVVIVNDTRYNYHHGCTQVMENLINLLINKNFNVVDTCSNGFSWHKNEQLVKNMKKSDLIVVNGEGTIHHNQEAGLQLLKISRFAKERNIKSVLINSTFEGNDSSSYTYLKDFDLISVRESLSQKELDKINIKSLLVPDLSFLSSSDILNIDNKSNIGFTDSVDLEITKTIYKKILNINNYLFMPILTYHKYKLIFHIRNFLFKISGREFKNSYEYRFFGVYNTYKYKKNISNLRLLVTARYHALCFALQLNIPFLAIESNTFKIQGLLKDIGIDNFRFVKKSDQLNFSKENLEKYFYFSNNELKKIKDYNNLAKIKINNLFDDISYIV